MNGIAKWLTDYVIHKGVVKGDERNIYEYGFRITLETGICIIISLIIAGALGMLVEGILFFIIFIPLRSYAGGLHLDCYWSCLSLSCLTLSVILLISKYLSVNPPISFGGLLLLEFAVWRMYPVENVNRSVDCEENIYFEKRLKKYLVVDLLIAVGCLAFSKEKFLLLCMLTFSMVVVTMLIGKYKYIKQNQKMTLN